MSHFTECHIEKSYSVIRYVEHILDIHNKQINESAYYFERRKGSAKSMEH